MTPQYTKIAFISTLVLAAGSLFSASASAAPLCPRGESFFGTIQRIQGRELTVRTPSGHSANVIMDSGARINSNGSTLRPGMFVGAYGCVTPNGIFHADQLTLSTHQSNYNERLTGTVRRIEAGNRLLVSQNGRGTGTWYVPDVDEYHVGQAVSGVGMIGSNGSFYPQSIDGRNTAYDTDATMSASRSTITLSGIVQRVNSNSISVWEPVNRTTGTWIVRGARRFRKGERVTAVGTEDRSGRFYVYHITAQ